MDEIQKTEKSFHFDLYRRLPVTLVRGEGTRVWDSSGREYLDFLSGIAVNVLGHGHPAIIRAINDQSAKLIHVSNIFYNEPQARLAELLTGISDFERVFFCNSGLEANEAAIKLARKIGNEKGKKGPIISFTSGFHGRSIASITMGSTKHQQGFGPLPRGFLKLPYNDVSSLKENVNDETVAIFVEAIQGEGGVNPAHMVFMVALQELCKKYEVLLVGDEIQTGFGRTGRLFGYQHYPILPDMITVAKALGGGFPIGALLSSSSLSSHFKYGDHGTTFGGNPLACAASLATVKTIMSENLIESAAELGKYFLEMLQPMRDRIPQINEIRGKGLMIGIDLSFPCRPVVLKMLEKGFIINCTAENVIRLLPPLIITKKEIDRLIINLEEAIIEEIP
ncbi:MAG: aspartate aminotransferase family protein [Cyclobacteriaceae bacterium]|nr:aspartate aminotransferase family protein [Cyclobacteriaceae bacterium]